MWGNVNVINVPDSILNPTYEALIGWLFSQPPDLLELPPLVLYKQSTSCYSKIHTDFVTPCKHSLRIWNPNQSPGFQLCSLISLNVGNPRYRSKQRHCFLRGQNIQIGGVACTIYSPPWDSKTVWERTSPLWSYLELTDIFNLWQGVASRPFALKTCHICSQIIESCPESYRSFLSEINCR